MKELNVISIIPGERHPLIFGTFDELGNGETFILINDHDPKPLYYKFLYEREGLFLLGISRAGTRHVESENNKNLKSKNLN